MPAFNAIKDWVMILSGLGMPENPMIGWVVHVFLGNVVWGGLFALLRPKLGRNAALSGIAFGILAWFGMMVVFMPMAGHGFFGLKIGPMVAVATLVLHIIYGALLGIAYAKIEGVTATA